MLPAFVGQTLPDVLDECRRLHVQCTAIAHQPSDRFPKDVIMSQEPAASARVREGRAVSLVVSSGMRIFSMPDLRFESLRDVQLVLARMHLRLAESRNSENDDVPANAVVSQLPMPGSSVHEGSEVRLVLSNGPPADRIAPSLVDLSIDAARQRATREHIRLGQIVWTSFGPGSPPRGTVLRQAPAAGKPLNPFDTISLQVSAGPGDAITVVRQAQVAIRIPPRDDAARVRVQLRDTTGTRTIFDGFAQGGQKFDLNVTAVGAATLDTYINEELLDSTVLGNEPSPIPTRSR